jgi:hypothetical protein
VIRHKDGAHGATRFVWLLRLLPRSFREEHGREMLQVWRQEAGEASHGGTRGVWIGALKDTLRIAPGEHLSNWRRDVVHAAQTCYVLGATC